MRKIGAIVAVLLLTAVVANAEVRADGRLKLVIEADGQAYIVNTTTTQLRIESYEISSLAGKLNPSPLYPEVYNADDEEWVAPHMFSPETAWASIMDRAAFTAARWYVVANGIPANPAYMARLTDAAMAGSNVGSTSPTTFAELSNTAYKLTEGNTSGIIWVRAAGAAAAIPLGKITDGTTLSDLTFVYGIATQSGGIPGNVYQGQIEILPEPATMGLLAFGGIAMLIRRRHR